MPTDEPARTKTWPARYRLHKYWSRKPPDEVARRIAAGSEPGQRVLDPFCGSGVAPIEAAILGRPALGVDVNPFAIALARATAAPCDADALAALGGRALGAARGAEGRWHRTRCRGCGADAELAASARDGTDLVAVVVRCGACGTRRECPEAADRRLARTADEAGDAGAPRPPVFAGWQTRKLVRAGLEDFGELFTPRNLRALGAIRHAILAEPAGAERDLALLALTGALAQASRMMADHSRAGGGASWKINIYWLPPRSLELDPFRCYENRLARVVAAKRETAALLHGADSPAFVCADVRELDAHVPPGSVRYVFADPPYGGEGIQYGELSALWCGWLEPPLAPQLETEIGENPVHARDGAAFAAGLAEAFAAIRRALASDGSMTVTFASRRAAPFDALRRALARAGFSIRDEHARGRSAPALTERTAVRGTRADVWLDCVPVRA